MAVKYHINPDKGPMPCSASIECPYGVDAPHFDNKADAQVVFEKQLSKSLKPLRSFRKVSKNSGSVDAALRSLESTVESGSYEDVINFANVSKKNYAVLKKLLDMRSKESPERFAKLDRLNPKKCSKDKRITQKTFTNLKREYESFRNHTAMLVEAFVESRFYEPVAKDYDVNIPLGSAVPGTAYEQDDPNWYLSRFNTIGGSDVGALVIKDFVPEEEKQYHDRAYIKKVEDSKRKKISLEDAMQQTTGARDDSVRKGALYRGTVWEDKIRDDYALQHPDLKVYKTKGQYTRNDDSWYRVNFDGLLSDRADGVPNGILEIKTGGNPDLWKDGPPIQYRAQCLYYLNATGFDYADICIQMHDSELTTYRIRKDDEVYPGSGVTMKEYVESRVKPWFDDLKSQEE